MPRFGQRLLRVGETCPRCLTKAVQAGDGPHHRVVCSPTCPRQKKRDSALRLYHVAGDVVASRRRRGARVTPPEPDEVRGVSCCVRCERRVKPFELHELIKLSTVDHCGLCARATSAAAAGREEETARHFHSGTLAHCTLILNRRG